MSALQTTRVIEVFADVVCPFTHVGLKRLVAYRGDVGRADVALRVRAWPLELVNDVRLSREVVTEEIAELQASVAPDLFSSFDPSLFPMTSVAALALASRAYRVSSRHGELVSLALRDALFEHGRDISDQAQLAALGMSLGIGKHDAADEDAVRADLREGRARGVIGSPHFFVDDVGFFCPTLEIRRVDGQMEIAFDSEGFTTFIGRCLPAGGD